AHGHFHGEARDKANAAIVCRQCGAKMVRPGLRRPKRSLLCLDCLTKNPAEPFALRLQAIRLAAGLTQRELAQHCGLCSRAVMLFEQGGQRPSRSSLAKLVRVLGSNLLADKRQVLVESRLW